MLVLNVSLYDYSKDLENKIFNEDGWHDRNDDGTRVEQVNLVIHSKLIEMI